MRTLLFILALTFAGCSDSTPSQQPPRLVSLDEVQAILWARDWIVSQGGDPADALFRGTKDDDGWTIYIEIQPPTPGAHTFLRFDETGQLIDVHRGR